ncbi:substrate-binding periplasmic protein [Curvivirga aplysinae]|uniref:substrate-binding periplasmic protein n=1 Tax=Curvivirga aplysinae TaxID=2529852 RepID=UPI0012BD5171|nr:transporter substrate-binding domain-containing protein [Curvivirga aplysinae]MTI08954.1 amino acid ABC transporter substrate-binding protein [Curvivirga aplysinae]
MRKLRQLKEATFRICRRSKFSTAILFSCFFHVTSPAYAQNACETDILVGYEHYPPFLIAPNGPLEGGYDFDILQALGQETGCKIKWVSRPWKRILQELSSGRIHIATSALMNLERQEFVYFSPAYRFAERGLFIRNGLNTSSFNSFLNSKLKLGLVSGYLYGEILDLDAPALRNQIEYANTPALNVLKLVNNRIDGTVEERAVFNYHLKQIDKKNQVIDTGIILQSIPMHLMISRKGLPKEVTTKLFEAISNLSQKGTFRVIARKYKEGES